jgi:hypothetical protein
MSLTTNQGRRTNPVAGILIGLLATIVLIALWGFLFNFMISDDGTLHGFPYADVAVGALIAAIMLRVGGPSMVMIPFAVVYGFVVGYVGDLLAVIIWGDRKHFATFSDYVKHLGAVDKDLNHALNGLAWGSFAVGGIFAGLYIFNRARQNGFQRGGFSAPAFGGSPGGAQPFGQPSAFGQQGTSSQPEPFGGALKNPSDDANPNFTPRQPAYGQPPAPQGAPQPFGQPQQPQPQFGQPPQPFGQPQPPQPFGQQQPQPFGQQQPQPFGQPPAPQGAPQPFGQPPAPAPAGQGQWGAPPQQPQPFGQPPAPAPQGAPQPFGQPQQGQGVPPQPNSPDANKTVAVSKEDLQRLQQGQPPQQTGWPQQ